MRAAARNNKKSIIFETVLSTEGKVDYIRRAIDDTKARLLFRMTDGKLFKQYTDDIPEWAKTLLI